jgi:hypothetical protein
MCFRFELKCRPTFPLLKNLKGVVTWVAFVVALVTACIPLGREGEGGCEFLLLLCYELYCGESCVLLIFNEIHFIFKKKKEILLNIL